MFCFRICLSLNPWKILIMLRLCLLGLSSWSYNFCLLFSVNFWSNFILYICCFWLSDRLFVWKVVEIMWGFRWVYILPEFYFCFCQAVKPLSTSLPMKTKVWLQFFTSLFFFYGHLMSRVYLSGIHQEVQVV